MDRGRGETQRILGTAQVVSDATAGVTISSVAVQAERVYGGREPHECGGVD